MTKTRQDLAEEVLLELGRADSANPAESPEDIATVKTRYASEFLALDDDNLVFWDENAIPERVFMPLVKYVAFECRQPFGALNYDPRDVNGRTPLQRLQALASRGAGTYRTVAEYF